MQTYYPPWLKSVLKCGAVLHLLWIAGVGHMCLLKCRDVLRHDRPRRRPMKAGKFDFNLSMRDEKSRELYRRALLWQPNISYKEEIGMKATRTWL